MSAEIHPFPVCLYRVTVAQESFTTYTFPATSVEDAKRYAERLTNDPHDDDDVGSLITHVTWSKGIAVKAQPKGELQ